MFIKFSDKTKNIIVKNSADDQVDGYADEDSVFLDSDDEDNRRLKAIRDDLEKKKLEDKS